MNASSLGKVIARAVETGNECLRIEQRNFGIVSLAVSADGHLLGLSGWKGLQVRQFRTGRLLHEIPSKGSAGVLAFSPDGKYLARGRARGDISLWHMAQANLERQFNVPCGINCLAFSADGKLLAAGGDDRAVHLWDLASGKETLHADNAPLGKVSFGPDDKSLLLRPTNTFYPPREARLVYMDLSGKVIRQVIVQDKSMRSFEFSPDGTTLAIGDTNSICLRDLESGKEDHVELTKPAHNILALKFSPDSKSLFVHWRDRAIGFGSSAIPVSYQVWRRTSPTTMTKVADLQGSHQLCATDGQWVALLSVPGLAFFRCESGDCFRRYPRLHGTLKAAGPSGRVLIFAPPRKEAPVLVELATGKPICKLECALEQRMDFFNYAVSPDGTTAAGGLDSGHILLWDACSGKQVAKLDGHRGFIGSLSFSRDGRYLVSRSADTTILLWDCTKILPKRAPAEIDLMPPVLDKLWQDLQASDGSRGYQAVATLVRSPASTILHLRKKVRPAAAADQREMRRWIADLDSDRFQVRQHALSELAWLGELADPVLKQALAKSLPLEVRNRINFLLNNIPNPPPVSYWLGTLRALETLERIATSDAKKLLEDLASGLPESTLTQEARRSLERLRKQSHDKMGGGGNRHESTNGNGESVKDAEARHSGPDLVSCCRGRHHSDSMAFMGTVDIVTIIPPPSAHGYLALFPPRRVLCSLASECTAPLSLLLPADSLIIIAT